MAASKKTVVRFPPSPTGPMHVGSARTAIYNYLFAQKSGGQFILRIEDTDKERSKKEYEQDIYDSLKWLGLDWDNKEKVLKQSERTEIYRSKIQELIKNGSAYISKESGGENEQVIRFKNPGGKIKFRDLIRGEIEMDTDDLKDFVIAKNIDEPLYHLAVVVDDMESGVTHIIRGEDHISNTPRQILIARALGKEYDFEFAHLPLVLAEDKSKLSKRKHGESVSLRYYRERGYQPEAILNFMALIGWNPGGEKEIFTLSELTEVFDLKKIQKKGGVFNVEKLDWMNKEHILRTPSEEQFSIFISQLLKTRWQDNEKIKDKTSMKKFLKIILERIHRWGEVSEIVEAGEFDYFFEKPKLEKQKILWKGQTEENAKKHLEKVLEMFGGGLDEKEVMQYATDAGKGDVLWPLRYALSGREKSPDPFTLIDILGVEESKNRITGAIKTLNAI